MARRSEADARASVAPAQKPWGASVSFGRGAVKPPAHGTRGAATARAKENDPYAHVRSRVAATQNASPKASLLPPAASAMAHKPKMSRLRPPAPAPAPAPALAAAPPAPSGATPGNLVAASSGFDDDVHPALAPFRAEDWSVPSDAAPASTSTALVAGCTLHDLAPEDKRKVAKLIKQVVEYAESKKRLERELDDTHSRLDACERSRDAARKAEETRKAELRVLTAKLDKALATVEAYRRREKTEKTEKTTDAPERAPPPGPAAAELWRMSPMTRAVVDEVRAVLRRGREHTGEPCAGNSDAHDAHDRKGGRSPAERQRPPLAVAPTSAEERWNPTGTNAERNRASRDGAEGPADGRGATRARRDAVYAPPTGTTRTHAPDAAEGGGQDHRGAPRKSPTKASRLRAAAAAAAGAGARAHERGGVFPATPELPEEVRAAAHAAAAASSPEDAFVAALAAGAAAAAAGVGGGRLWTDPPASPGAVPGPAAFGAPLVKGRSSGPLERERVLRFDPRSGAAGAFYFDASSETGSEAQSERAASAARTVRQALGVPEPESTESPPRGVSLAAATRALVRLDDDMTAYGAATMRPSTFANLDGVSPPRRKRASAFAPVRDEGASRLATIAARMARDDAYAERDAAPRSPHVPAPPASLVAAAARARVAAGGGDAAALGEPVGEAIRTGDAADAVPCRRGRFAPRTVASPLVTASATASATASGPAEDRKLSANENPRTGKAQPEKLNPTRLSRAHAAVRAAAAAVDAALAGDAHVDADDAVPETPEPRGFAEETPSEEERIPIVAPTEAPREDPEDPEDPADEPRSVRAEKAPTKLDPAPRERSTSTDPVERTDDVRPVPLAETKDILPGLPEKSSGSSGSSGSSPSSSTQRARRSETAFDADLIDLVDEVDELRLFAPVDDDASGDAYGARRRFGRDGKKTDCPYTRRTNPRAAAAAAARRVAGRAYGQSVLPEKARRRRLADEVTRRETQRRREHSGTLAEKAEWRVNYRSFSEGKRGEPLL